MSDERLTNLTECSPVCPVSIKPLSLVDETKFDPVRAIDAQSHYDEKALKHQAADFKGKVLTGLTHPGTHACNVTSIKKERLQRMRRRLTKIEKPKCLISLRRVKASQDVQRVHHAQLRFLAFHLHVALRSLGKTLTGLEVPDVWVIEKRRPQCNKSIMQHG